MENVIFIILEDISFFFELYPLSLKKGISIFISNSKYLPNFNEIPLIIEEIMKKIDILIVCVFMEILPIEYGRVEQF